MNFLKQGSSSFRKANFALFAGGFVTFAILYCTQPLMPVFSEQFHLSPATSSLSLSVTTIALSIFMLVFGSLSESWGRKSIMTVALFISSVLAFFTAFSPTFHILLIFRVLQGVVLAGLPSIAMAYLSEEVDPISLGLAMGLYISGNSIGGMSGRIITGMLTDSFSWRVAIGSIGLLSILASVCFWLLLPPSRHFQPRKLNFTKLLQSLFHHLQDPGLLCLYGISFLLMGSFVTLYNYIGYQLTAAPYHLSQTLVGWIFIVYIVGSFSSTWMGKLADRYGRRKVLWLAIAIMLSGACLSLSSLLLIKITSIAVFTFGFFGGHSIASSWVGRRAIKDKAQASSLYLFFYYLGSSISGTAGGLFWSHFGWIGIVGIIVIFLIAALLISIKLATITPIVSMNKQAT